MTQLEEFKEDATKMWDVASRGESYKLSIDKNELKNPLVKLLLPKRNVDYHILKDDDGITKVFIRESSKKYDWIQNFMFYTSIVKLGGKIRLYHTGFYLTAITVFNHMKSIGALDNQVVEAYGYSHGAGALSIFGSLVRCNTNSKLVNDSVVKFESPRCIFLPSKSVRKECASDISYRQGIDVVPTIPMWMSPLGIERRVKGQDLTGIERIFRFIYDHDIYWTQGE